MDVANAVRTVSYSMLTVTWCHSECCVLSGLDFEAAAGSVVCYYCFALRALSHCKHDMGAHSQLNAAKLKECPPPFWQGAPPMGALSQDYSTANIAALQLTMHRASVLSSDVAAFTTYTYCLYFRGHGTPLILLLFYKQVAIEKHASCSRSCSKIELCLLPCLKLKTHLCNVSMATL